MEIFDRYILEVTGRLPRNQRGDVAKELRSTLQDSLDGHLAVGTGDGSAAGGGALARGADSTGIGSRQEAAALEVLRDFGPPRELAASYLTGPQYLIGPGLYPGFMTTLKVTLLVVGGLQLVVSLFGIGGPSGGLRRFSLEVLVLFGELQSTVLGLLGLIVFIFWLIERFSPDEVAGETVGTVVGSTPSDRSWNPADLPPLKDPDRVDRSGEVICLVFTCLALLIFNFHSDRVGAFVSLNGDGEFVPLLGPAYRLYLPWWNAYLIGGAIAAITLLKYNRWTPLLRGLDLGLALLLVAILWWMTQGDPLLQPEFAWPEGSSVDSNTVERFEKVVAPVLRVTVRVGLWIWLVVAGYSALSKTAKLIRRGDRS